MIYKRKILKEISKRINDKEIIVLTGMRRTGKTTLYREIFKEIKGKNKIFLDLENPIEQKIFEEKDYNNIINNFKKFGFSEKSKSYVFIDEVQAMPEAVKAIKYLYDHYDIKFFLTGSSSFYLKNLFPESLAGRKFVFDIYPLDFEEFLVFKEAKTDFDLSFDKKIKNKHLIFYEKHKKFYEEYLDFGGFPEVVLAEEEEKKEMRLNDIFKSFFEKDVKMLADFREIKIFRDLILLLMARASSKIEVTRLSSELGVSRGTIYSYISFLENTYFISLVNQFSGSVDNQVRGSKKVYICDNGLLNLFAKISEGSLFENAIFLNLKKYGKINYYYNKTGGEIDFILNNKIALEVKITGTESDYKRLKKLSQPLNIKKYFLITKKFNENKYSIPALNI